MPSGALQNDGLCDGTDNDNGKAFDVIDNDEVLEVIGKVAELWDAVVNGNDDDADE
jgi:hypothetical protein